MEVKGKVKAIFNTESVGSNGFQKRDIVVTTDEQYPQDISIQFVQDKCSILDGYAFGDNVTVGVNLRGREWVNPEGEAKYFNTIQGWRITKEESAPLANTPVPPSPTMQPLTEEEKDDLPF